MIPFSCFCPCFFGKYATISTMVRSILPLMADAFKKPIMPWLRADYIYREVATYGEGEI